MKSSQLKIFFLMLLLAAAVPLFADDLPAGLQTVADKVEGVFKGPLIRTILVCCLAGCGVAYGFNKDNEKMKRNVIAIGIGIIIVGAATEIVRLIFSASGGGNV